MTTWFSLHRRLLALLLGGVSVCWLATLVWSYADAHHEIDELFDAQLAQAAQALLAQSGRHRAHDDDDRHDDVEELEHAAHRYQRALKFQIWHDDGALVLRSPNAPTTPLAQADGYSETRGADGHWRFYSQWDQHRRHRVQVAENHAVRDELIGHIAWRLLVPALFGLPLLGVWVWFATRRALAPLDAAAAEIGARAPERLQPVAPESAPAEIRPLLDALNDLFRRVEQAIEGERRFTADAAHELRTPLAAIAAQARVAARARDEAERSHALAQLAAGTARAAHLVDQLLTLARLDPQQGAPHAAVRLDALAEEVCAAHGLQALEKGIALELEAAPAEAGGNGELLRILLRNLVDNAIRYTPRNGRVAVAVAPTQAGVRLTVVDSGPGIPAAERERMLERFSRLAGQEIDGSGLGLSIVRRIAELHGARLTLGDAPGGGLAVSVDFPVARQD
ncbi:MAG: ATP-binding protein [Sterolibacteriaceae bacterium MAG5]|nr:ATP-binding protein [Candidatus Nitricoxidireducens bremensis]